MHRKTFQAYKDRGEYLQAKRLLAGLKETRDWYSPKAMQYFDGYIEWEAKYTVEEYKQRHSKSQCDSIGDDTSFDKVDLDY